MARTTMKLYRQLNTRTQRKFQQKIFFKKTISMKLKRLNHIFVDDLILTV